MTGFKTLNSLNRLPHMARSFFSSNQVGFLIFFVTNRCNFRCPFCFYYAEIEKGRKPEELTLDEIEQFTRKLGPVLQLSLTGGEPFLRNDLDEIASLFIRNNYVTYLTIPTNASLSDRMVKFLEELLPRHPTTYFRICFSIDGINDQHDENRKAAGSYEKIKVAYSAISPLRKHFPNLVLDSNTVYTASTEPSMLNILKTISKEFDFDNVSITYARGKIHDEKLKTVSAERYIQANEYLLSIRRKKESRFLYPLFRAARDVSREHLIRTVFHDEFVVNCVAGRKLAVVSETGDVYPCEVLEQSMGNLRSYDFDLPALLAESKNVKLRERIINSQCKCSFECAIAASTVWNYKTYAKIASSAVKNIGRESSGQ